MVKKFQAGNLELALGRESLSKKSSAAIFPNEELIALFKQKTPGHLVINIYNNRPNFLK